MVWMVGFVRSAEGYAQTFSPFSSKRYCPGTPLSSFLHSTFVKKINSPFARWRLDEATLCPLASILKSDPSVLCRSSPSLAFRRLCPDQNRLLKLGGKLLSFGDRPSFSRIFNSFLPIFPIHNSNGQLPSLRHLSQLSGLSSVYGHLLSGHLSSVLCHLSSAL